MGGVVETVADGVRLSVRLTPRARRNAVEGVREGALRVCVTAPAEGGKANAALVALLAKTWRLPKSAIAIGRGAKNRNKTLRIAGDGPALTRRIGEWIDDHGRAGENH